MPKHPPFAAFDSKAAPARTSAAPAERDIERALQTHGLPVFTAPIRSQLAVYLGLLMKWNKVMNLVGARNWSTALLELVADSFYLDTFMAGLNLPPDPEIWDLGAGAGLPGIPLRIIRQDGAYRMIEAREKRALFIANALSLLKLPRTFVHQARVEVFFQNPPGAGQAQVILSRAFMPWREVLELARPHLAPQGLVLIMSNGSEEQAPPEAWQSAGHMAYALADGQRMLQAFKLL